MEGGATWLATALVEEAVNLRHSGIDVPILVLSEPPASAMSTVAEHDMAVVLYTQDGIIAAARAGSQVGRPVHVHVKVDTGMHRVGAQPAEAVRLATMVADAEGVELEGLCTHFAVADEPERRDVTVRQLGRFTSVVDELEAAGIRPRLCHAANSAGTICFPEARLDMVRCGIAIYGLAPAPELKSLVDLRPALTLRSAVSFVKSLRAGQAVSYGLRWTAPQDTVVATVPIGYADGVPRRLSSVGGEALVGGRRLPIVGTVTMDQLLVDCGPGAEVRRGDEVVLIGAQGYESIGAWEWATKCDTIAYEVTCGISVRVPRQVR